MHFEGGHVGARGNIETDSAAYRITLIAAAANFLGLDAGWMFDFERPVNAVQDVAAHIAERAVAEIVPTMPFVWMKILMEFAIGSRANPFVPMQTFRHWNRRRTRADAAIGAIGPAMGFSDVAHDPAPDKF